MVKVFVTAILVIAGCCFALERDATSLPPGGLSPSQVPQFVCIGFDDNYLANGLKWALDSSRAKVNPTTTTPNTATYDGKPVRFSFYVNSNNGNGFPITSSNALGTQFKQILTDGAEIGSHTRTHITGATTSLSTWITEMNGCWTDLASIGISKDTVVGFRTPYLIYNANTFKAIDSLKFRYDCSIESGFEDSVDGTNFVWPYTLDKGSADSAGTGINIGKEPGVWEAPVYCYIVPPALRHQIAVKAKENFDSTTGKITGLDWNMWMSEGGSGGCGMTPAEVLSTLEYDLDQRLAGNRAPFCVGAHTTLYDTLQFDVAGGADTFPKTAGTIKNMRNTISAFIAYALTKPQVRVVPTREMLRWCTNPVPLSTGTPVVAAGENTVANGLINATVTNRSIAVTGLHDAGKVVLRLVSLNGREVARTCVQQNGGSANWNPTAVATGAYILSVETNSVTVEKKISIQ
jgi:hypothetical protein